MKATNNTTAWMDIETAPKDGGVVLAYWACTLDGQVIHNDKSYAMTRFKDGVWMNADDDEDLFSDPTHWMPLPEPPKE